MDGLGTLAKLTPNDRNKQSKLWKEEMSTADKELSPKMQQAQRFVD